VPVHIPAELEVTIAILLGLSVSEEERNFWQKLLPESAVVKKKNRKQFLTLSR